MFTPKKTKFRRSFLKFDNRVATKGLDIEFGEYAIIALRNTFLTAKQMESARKVISSTTKRTGKLWFRVFPDKTMTAKGANVRMGSGKGALSQYVVNLKRGQIILEVGGLDKELAIKALTKASKKLPTNVKIIEKGVL